MVELSGLTDELFGIRYALEQVFPEHQSFILRKHTGSSIHLLEGQLHRLPGQDPHTDNQRMQSNFSTAIYINEHL